MPDNLWKQYGKDYGEVNQNLGGLPDVVRKAQVETAGSPEPGYSLRNAILSSVPRLAKMFGATDDDVVKAQEWRRGWDSARLAEQQKNLTDRPALGNVVAGTQGVISGATMGLPGAAQKVLGETEAAKTSRQLREQYPTASTAGELAGGLASAFAIPGAGEAAAARGGFLATKGLLPALGRAALNTATTAVPTAINQAIAGDPGQAWRDFKSNLAFGTVGGAVLGKLLSSLPKLSGAMREVADDLTLHSAGVSGRSLRSVAAGGKFGKAGASGEKVRALKDAVAEVIGREKLYGPQAIEEFTKGSGKLWDAVDDAFAASGARPSQYLDEIVNHPELSKLLNDPQYGQQVGNYVQDALGRADALTALSVKTGKSALPDIREILTKDIKNGIRSTDVAAQLKGEVADAIHDVIDGHFVPAGLKEAWPGLKLLKMAAQRQESTIRGVTEAGSATAPRLAVQQLLGGAGLGAAAGGVGAAQAFDPNDPTTWGTAAGRLAMGTVGGAMANRLMAGAANQVAGRTAGLVRGMIPKISEATAAALGQAGPKAAEAIGTGRLFPGAEVPAEQVLTPDQASMVAMRGGEAPPAEHAQDMAVATRKEQQLEPEQVQAADRMMDPSRAAIKAKLLSVWQSWENPYKDDWDKFYQDARTYTDNFDPLNTYTAKIIGGRDYKDYLRSYNVALRLQTLGPDLAMAIAPARVPPIMERLSPGLARGREARTELVNTIYTAMTGDLKAPSTAERKAIEGRLEALRNQRLTPNSAKKRLLDMLERDYNVRFDLLNQYGLAG